MTSKARQKKAGHFLVTAGPTREKIDPVRFISNYSTGTFGYAIAEEARRRGNKVTLVSGPTDLEPPKGLKFIQVESALEMRYAVLKEFSKADCIIMAAAISDWRAHFISKHKLKKDAREVVRLIENPDILAELGKKNSAKTKTIVGFALETENLEENALKKLKDKNLDLIVANKLKPAASVFGNTTMDVVVIDRFGNRARIRGKTKQELAKIILDKVSAFTL